MKTNHEVVVEIANLVAEARGAAKVAEMGAECLRFVSMVAQLSVAEASPAAKAEVLDVMMVAAKAVLERASANGFLDAVIHE
jgi:hypothetical protein